MFRERKTPLLTSSWLRTAMIKTACFAQFLNLTAVDWGEFANTIKDAPSCAPQFN